MSDLSDEVRDAEGTSFFKIKSPSDGIIIYQTDGYEGKTVDTFTGNDFDTKNYKKKVLTSNTKINAGDPVYKRINSEHWNIILPISETLAKELETSTYVSIRFCKDDYTTNAECSVIKEEEKYYLNLALERAMIRYANDRFIDVELLLNDNTGLKIPKSAITSKEFFIVPKEYFVKNEEENSDTLYLKLTSVSPQAEKPELVAPTIYYASDTHYYIDSEKVTVGTTVSIPDSTDIYTIGTETDSLIGVYNINKGYAVFKQIKILFENEEYAIVATKTSYGIALYDHIALDAKSIKEDQLIVK